MSTPEPGPARGVLHEPAPAGDMEHRRIAPPEALAPWVAHFWWVRWNLTAPFVAETLPHPCVHLLFEHEGPAVVAGPSQARFVRTLVGAGHVFGVKLRPAVLAQGGALAERVVPLREWLGQAGAELEAAVADAATCDEKCERVVEQLRLPTLSADSLALRDLIERLAVDRSLLRVEQVAALLGVDVRTLQRRFRQYVGVSAKWVLQRYRMHEAAERLAEAEPPALAELALELGYADQAHFARDFKRAVGRTPARYASRARGHSGTRNP